MLHGDLLSSDRHLAPEDRAALALEGPDGMQQWASDRIDEYMRRVYALRTAYNSAAPSNRKLPPEVLRLMLVFAHVPPPSDLKHSPSTPSVCRHWRCARLLSGRTCYAARLTLGDMRSYYYVSSSCLLRSPRLGRYLRPAGMHPLVLSVCVSAFAAEHAQHLAPHMDRITSLEIKELQNLYIYINDRVEYAIARCSLSHLSYPASCFVEPALASASFNERLPLDLTKFTPVAAADEVELEIGRTGEPPFVFYRHCCCCCASNRAAHLPINNTATTDEHRCHPRERRETVAHEETCTTGYKRDAVLRVGYFFTTVSARFPFAALTTLTVRALRRVPAIHFSLFGAALLLHTLPGLRSLDTYTHDTRTELVVCLGEEWRLKYITEGAAPEFLRTRCPHLQELRLRWTPLPPPLSDTDAGKGTEAAPDGTGEESAQAREVSLATFCENVAEIIEWRWRSGEDPEGSVGPDGMRARRAVPLKVLAIYLFPWTDANADAGGVELEPERRLECGEAEGQMRTRIGTLVESITVVYVSGMI
ncbi:hypothetical protein C8Q80DRAFT_290326 [Daedaleopsis nitida]|nr:hypothetical protein C8Q80DRAFT_290326 [Daedaleopsis nitida]